MSGSVLPDRPGASPQRAWPMAGSAVGRYDPEMATPTGLRGAGQIGLGLGLALHGPGRLTYRLGEGDEVVGAGRRWLELTLMPYDLPASGGGEATGVRLAEVVGVRLGEGRERAHYGCRLVIDIRQRGYGLTGAAVAGATPWGPHGGTVSPLPASDPRLAVRHAGSRDHNLRRGSQPSAESGVGEPAVVRPQIGATLCS